MAETVGLLILSAAGLTESVTGIGTAVVTIEVAGTAISAASVVGAAAITAASIGLQYALNNPSVPKPENGAQPLKQSIPSRQRGYWINRLGGYYMLSLAAGGDSQDMLAFHSGRIEEVLQLYLHDQPVSTVPALTHGANCTVQAVGADWFKNCINVQVFFGYETQNSNGLLNPSSTSGVWTSAFAGKGIACLAMVCQHQADPSTFTKRYPQNLPLPSVVAKCAPIWDPRDVTQSLDDRDSWKASPNGALQLIDFLTEPDGGMGEDRDILFPPAVLAAWMAEADLCDDDVGGRARYETAGYYRFDNSPESIIGNLLASCDGWFAEAGDGSLALAVGVYREPTDPPLTAKHIRAYRSRKGVPDEEATNQLDVTFNNPAAGYVTDSIPSVRDEAAISAAGIVRAKQLDLSWVQNADQAETLGARAMLRVNPRISGTFITTLYGARYLGKRYVKVQFPKVKGMEDCVIEIQPGSSMSVLEGRVTLNWNLVDPVSLAALDNSPPPAFAREDATSYRREDGFAYIREDS